MARRNSAYGVHSMAKGLAQAPHWPRSRNGTSERTTPWGGGGRLRVCKPPPSLAREGRAADSPAGRFDGLRRTHPLCAVSSSSPGLRIQGPGLQNPRGHGLPCAAPGRTVGSSGGLTQSGGCSKRRSIPATVPAAPTPLARSAPPARCPGPISGTIYHVPLLRSPTTTPEPLPLLPLCPTALYHAMLWYTPSMRTRVPSFGQTFPNKVGPCQKLLFGGLALGAPPPQRARAAAMAFSKLSGDEQGIILGQLRNALEPRLVMYFSSASKELRALLPPAARQQLRD